MAVDTSSWEYKDYLAFLMVYAANADFSINEKEKAYIKKRVGKDEFDRMVQFYKDLHDMECINLLIEFKEKYCHSEEDLDTILKDFNKVLLEDHEIDAEEEAVYVGIRHLLRNID